MSDYDKSLDRVGEMLYGRDVWEAMVRSAADLKEENKVRAATAPQGTPRKGVHGDEEQKPN